MDETENTQQVNEEQPVQVSIDTAVNEQKTQTVAVQVPKKHSGLGIASLAIAILVGLVEIISIVAATAIELNTPGGIDENSFGMVALGLTIIAGIFVSMIGIGLGIAGIVQSDRKKVLAIVGLILNIASSLMVVALIIIGNVIK